MKKIYRTQMIVLVLALSLISGLVLIPNAFAQGGGGSGSGSGTQDRDRIQDPTTHDGDEPLQDRDRIQGATVTPTQDRLRTQDRDRIQDPATHTGDEPLQDRDRLRDRDRITINMETDTNPAANALQLRATIQNREQELNREATTTAEQYREIIQEQNRTRLAVRAIFASKNLLGTVSPQVMQIAEEINNSVQTTVNAEASIEARGFFTHVFFGGDKTNSRILQQEQEQNNLRIQEIKNLISDGTVNMDVRNTLEIQLRNMEEEQTRLAQLAEKELKQWGIFSWRL